MLCVVTYVHGTHVEVRGQRLGVSSLLPSWGRGIKLLTSCCTASTFTRRAIPESGISGSPLISQGSFLGKWLCPHHLWMQMTLFQGLRDALELWGFLSLILFFYVSSKQNTKTSSIKAHWCNLLVLWGDRIGEHLPEITLEEKQMSPWTGNYLPAIHHAQLRKTDRKA